MTRLVCEIVRGMDVLLTVYGHESHLFARARFLAARRGKGVVARPPRAMTAAEAQWDAAMVAHYTSQEGAAAPSEAGPAPSVPSLVMHGRGNTFPSGGNQTTAFEESECGVHGAVPHIRRNVRAGAGEQQRGVRSSAGCTSPFSLPGCCTRGCPVHDTES